MTNIYDNKPHLRYKRLRRVPKKYLPNIVLQEQDERIFTQLTDYGMLDTKQLRLLNPSINKKVGNRYFVDRLGMLFEHGYIHRLQKQYDREKPRKHVIYTAKDKDPSVGFPHIRHTMMINDFRLALTLALQNHPEARLALWKKDGEVYDRVAAQNNRTGKEEYLTVKPDAFFIINHRGRDYPFCFEADRATLTQQSQNDWRDMTRKITAYWNWRQQKRHTKLLNIEHFRVLTITISKQRSENMRHVVQEVALQKNCKGLLPGMYLFGREGDYTIDKPESILQEIWFSAKDVDELKPYSGRRYSFIE